MCEDLRGYISYTEGEWEGWRSSVGASMANTGRTHIRAHTPWDTLLGAVPSTLCDSTTTRSPDKTSSHERTTRTIAGWESRTVVSGSHPDIPDRPLTLTLTDWIVREKNETELGLVSVCDRLCWLSACVCSVYCLKLKELAQLVVNCGEANVCVFVRCGVYGRLM